MVLCWVVFWLVVLLVVVLGDGIGVVGASEMAGVVVVEYLMLVQYMHPVLICY